MWSLLCFASVLCVLCRFASVKMQQVPLPGDSPAVTWSRRVMWDQWRVSKHSIDQPSVRWWCKIESGWINIMFETAMYIGSHRSCCHIIWLLQNLFFMFILCASTILYIHISYNPNTWQKLLAFYAVCNDASECWNTTATASKLFSFQLVFLAGFFWCAMSNLLKEFLGMMLQLEGSKEDCQ